MLIVLYYQHLIWLLYKYIYIKSRKLNKGKCRCTNEKSQKTTSNRN